MDAFQEFYHAPVSAREAVAGRVARSCRATGFEALALRDRRPAPHGDVVAAACRRRRMPPEMLKPIET